MPPLPVYTFDLSATVNQAFNQYWNCNAASDDKLVCTIDICYQIAPLVSDKVYELLKDDVNLPRFVSGSDDVKKIIKNYIGTQGESSTLCGRVDTIVKKFTDTLNNNPINKFAAEDRRLPSDITKPLEEMYQNIERERGGTEKKINQGPFKDDFATALQQYIETRGKGKLAEVKERWQIGKAVLIVCGAIVGTAGAWVGVAGSFGGVTPGAILATLGTIKTCKELVNQIRKSCKDLDDMANSLTKCEAELDKAIRNGDWKPGRIAKEVGMKVVSAVTATHGAVATSSKFQGTLDSYEAKLKQTFHRISQLGKQEGRIRNNKEALLYRKPDHSGHNPVHLSQGKNGARIAKWQKQHTKCEEQMQALQKEAEDLYAKFVMHDNKYKKWEEKAATYYKNRPAIVTYAAWPVKLATLAMSVGDAGEGIIEGGEEMVESVVPAVGDIVETVKETAFWKKMHWK